MALKEYAPGSTFPGRMGRTIGESEPAWPAPLRAKPGAPNVLFIVLDDTGFGQLGCYGSPINTPNINRLAANGLLYSNMHTTALCSPSRSCMLTGRNHHSNAMSCITEGSEGYPGSNGAIPFENGFLSEMLLQRGYNTYCVGKWHLTPSEQVSAAGPYDRWPLGRGFERYYGFLGGDTSQYYPDLVYDNHQVEPPKTPEQGYHLTEDLVDKTIQLISDAKQLAPEKPFVAYFATGALHAPHHAPKAWADKYKGAFDDGWDAYRDKVFKRQKELGIIPANTVLSRHDPDVQDWDKLPADERKLYALDDLGGPKYFNHYAWGWTFAGNTPFRRWKRETYRGGVSDPFLVHWPAGIKAKGQIRHQYAHAIDMLPTVLDCLGLEPPAQIRGVTQSPIQGVSFKHTFDDAKAESKRRTQYFEMFGHRAIYHDGWRAVCPFPGPSFAEAKALFGALPLTEEKLRELDAKGWELYNVVVDAAETKNLADMHRDKLIEMIALWYVEAGRYDVLPLDSRGTARFADERPQLAADRATYVYYPHTQAIPENVAVKVLNRAHSFTASVEIPKGGAEGVLVSHGGNAGGYTFFVKDKKLHYVHNYVGSQEFHVESKDAVPEGKAELRFEFEPTGKPDVGKGKGAPGRVQFYINGTLAGRGDIPVTVPLLLSLGEGLTVGRDAGAPISSLWATRSRTPRRNSTRGPRPTWRGGEANRKDTARCVHPESTSAGASAHKSEAGHVCRILGGRQTCLLHG